MKPTSQASPPPTRLSALLGAFSDPALLLDIRRTILAANREFEETFGDGDCLTGRHCFEILHCRTSACPGECPLQRCLTTREATRAVHVHSSPFGETHTEIEMRPLLDENGDTESLLEILRPLRVTSATPSRDRLVGRSPTFLHLLKNLLRVAPNDRPALIYGEPGSGKELVARTLHQLSNRAEGPFVPVDCSSLREWQFERELFGHVPGAFPGACEPAPGLLRAAKGGTLLLDEISTLAGSLQAKLLRLLETGIYFEEGGSEPCSIDFRLICTAASDLRDLVQRNAFREDLRLFLSVFPIEVPPLRQRPEDIPLLIESLQQAIDTADRCRGLSTAALTVLERYSFPGNVRELRGILERACLMAEGGFIEPGHLPAECRAAAPGLPLRELHFDGDVIPLGDLEWRYIDWAARKLHCNHRDLARILGISERTLYRKLRRKADSSH